MPGQSKDQCQSKWKNIKQDDKAQAALKSNKARKRAFKPPPRKKAPSWTQDEDDLLVLTYNKVNGKEGRGNWDTIAAKIPGRNDDQCRNRYKLLNKKLKQPIDEDGLLAFLAEQFGEQTPTPPQKRTRRLLACLRL